MATTRGTWGSLLGPLSNIDFGLTERYAPWLGVNQNRVPTIGPNDTSVLGMSTQQANQYYSQRNTSNDTGQKTSTNTGGAYISPQPVINNPTDTGTQEASDEARRREEETRNAIESGYGSYLSGLGGLQSSYQTAQGDELSSASKTYEQIFGGLTDQKSTNLDKLQAGREEVGARQATSIKDLQTNLSNVLRGASMQFGAMGAGDTSATRTMLPYAYTKLAGQQEGGIRNQSNSQMFDIGQQERDTELEYTKMWRQTEVDKEGSLQGIKNYYGDAIRNVQTAMAQAPLDKANSLASLSQALLQEAQSNLRQLEAENRQRQENIKTWATNRMSELNNLKLELSGSAPFKPQDIVWNELQMQGVQPDNGMNYGDYVTGVRKKYLGQ